MHISAHGLLCAQEVDLLVTVVLVDAAVPGASMLWATDAGAELKVYGICNAISIVDLFQCCSKALAGWSFAAKEQLQGWLVGSC